MASKENLMSMLLDMGFGNNRAVRGLQATGFKVFCVLRRLHRTVY